MDTESNASAIATYRDLSRRIMLAGVGLERFTLRYWLANIHRSEARRLQFWLSQEAGASGGMAYEIIATKQLGLGRRHPLRIDKGALRDGFRTVLTGSVIAGSGSAVSLAANVGQAWHLRRKGYDAASANKYVLSQLRLIDDLMAQRARLVNAQSASPLKEIATAEGQVLENLRDAYVYEYSRFKKDLTRYRAYENTFFLLNIATNAVTAVTAHYGLLSVSEPRFNGTTNILFMLAGALAAVSPLVSTTSGALAGRLEAVKLRKQIGHEPKFDAALIEGQVKRLEEALAALDPGQTRTAAAVARSGAYGQSVDLFSRQLQNEAKMTRILDHVALQSTLLAPPIGGTLLAQGVLGTVGYYDYGRRPRKLLDLAYKGSVSGLAGASVTVGATACLLVAQLYYLHHLHDKKQLPAQIIEERLKHLDDIERIIKTI